MKVAFFVGLFPCISQTFVLNQITGLIDRGHDVDIFAVHGDDPNHVHPDVSKYQLLARTCYLDSPITGNFLGRSLRGLALFTAHFQNAPLGLLRSLNVVRYGRQAASLRLLYSIIPLIEKQQTQGKLVYDVIHAQFGTQGLIVQCFRELGVIQGKLITTFRGYDISQYLQMMGEDVYQPLFKSGDFFLTNCEFFRHRALKIGCDSNKLRVLGSGIDCDRFTFAPRHYPDDGVIRIVTTGRLVEKKGIEYGIRAIAQLAKTHSQIQYLIIGDGPLKAALQALVDELHMHEVIQFLGQKKQQEIIRTLEQAQLFIAPCVTAADGNQDAPVNVLKEAMAMGLPVVSTIHGGIPELVEDGISGFLVPERDVEALATKLADLIAHPEWWVSMGKAGHDFVKSHYGLTQLNDELVDIYQHLIDPTGKFMSPTRPTVNFELV